MIVIGWSVEMRSGPLVLVEENYGKEPGIRRARRSQPLLLPQQFLVLLILTEFFSAGIALAVDRTPLGTLIDVSEDFKQTDSTYFVPVELVDFNPATGTGSLKWNRYRRQAGLSFNKNRHPFFACPV